MNKAKLVLLSCSWLLLSMLIVSNPGQAREIVFEATNQQDTPISKQPKTELIPKEQTSKNETLEFTEEESNIVMERYGCDCNACVNKIRQSQGKLPLL